MSNTKEKIILRFQQEMDKIYAELAEYERQVEMDNNALLEKIGPSAKEDLEEMLDGAEVTGKMEVVDKPAGQDNDESFGGFSEVFVQQWSTGTEGDSFEGFIFGKFDENQWLKIPYRC